MNFNIENSLGDKTFGRVKNEDIKTVTLFATDLSDNFTLKVVLENGSEITVSSDGRANIVEWDRDAKKATFHTLSKGLVEALVVKS